MIEKEPEWREMARDELLRHAWDRALLWWPGAGCSAVYRVSPECTALEDFVHALTAGRAPTTGLHGAL